MSFLSKIASISLALFLAHSVLAATPRASREIDEETAYRLATLYMYRYLSFCGAAQDPVSHGRYWYVPLRMGQGADLYGSVHIDKRTGVITYRGKTFEDPTGKQQQPPTTAKELESWAKTPAKPHLSP